MLSFIPWSVCAAHSSPVLHQGQVSHPRPQLPFWQMLTVPMCSPWTLFSKRYVLTFQLKWPSDLRHMTEIRNLSAPAQLYYGLWHVRLVFITAVHLYLAELTNKRALQKNATNYCVQYMLSIALVHRLTRIENRDVHYHNHGNDIKIRTLISSNIIF